MRDDLDPRSQAWYAGYDAATRALVSRPDLYQKAGGKTPTIAVFVRGGLVQDVCADMPCRVIVLDFDNGGIPADDDRAVRHTHPDGSEEYAEVADYARTPTAFDRLHVHCAIATAADAEHGSDEPTEITDYTKAGA